MSQAMETSVTRSRRPGARLGAAHAGWRILGACVVALSLLGVPAPAQAQLDAFLGSPIASVRLEADGQRVTDPPVLGLIETRVGQPLAMLRVRETIDHLVLLGRYDDIAVDASHGERGVDLVYQVTHARVVTRIDFRGRVEISRGRMRRLLRDGFGATPRVSRVPEMSAALVEAYKGAGYFRPSVSAAATPEGRSGEARVAFTIDAGPRARIGAIAVTGSAPGGRARLLDELDLAEGRPWDATELSQRVERFTGRLRSQGYYEATLDVSSTPRADGSIVDVTLQVEAGPLVELAFEGDPLPKARLDTLVPIRREGSADEDLLEDSKRRIEDVLHQQGYWRASVEYRRSELDGRLRIVFVVTLRQRYIVSRVEVAGTNALPRAEIEALFQTRPGAPLVQAMLLADQAAVETHYRQRGYASVKVSAVPEPVATPDHGDAETASVIARLSIEEGNLTRVGQVALRGNAAFPDSTLRSVLKLAPGAPFYEPQLASDRSALLLTYLNRGYRDATVEATTAPGAEPGTVDLLYTIAEGGQAIVDHVIVVGNSRTDLDTIERALQLGPGDPVGLGALVEAQQRLSTLGLFRRVRVEDRALPGESARDILVTVDEAPATTIGYGVGLEAGRKLRRREDGTAVEEIDVAPRVFFEVGRRNLWGKNRSVNLFSRASFRRSNASSATDTGQFGFNEYRVVGSYREPRVFGWNADGQVTAFLEQAVRTSFSYRRNGVNADLTRRVSDTLTLIGRYTFGNTSVFDEQYNPADQPLIDRLFPQVRLGLLSGGFARDTRDDPLEPTRGTFVSSDLALALEALGGEVGYLKGFGEASAFRRLPGSNRLVVAGAARIGLATGFKRFVRRVNEDGQETIEEVKDLPASERFYAGGGTTVRGFAQDRLGAAGTIDQDGFPTGGNAVMILNGELRFPLWRSVGGVAFADAGNVFLKASDFDLAEIRGTVGLGVRYRSPVGPIRVDVGFKLDRETTSGGTLERGYVVHLGLGQAF